ncbi:alpha/beta-hydrolase [Coniochaeta ligniaria NRRL 30616]|uniref:Alpha/beta-hydrolase n=1 Tax=Coniochaeta ligniaria NRRL 30616 TaxID=1408157 RepID=A0A1J7I7D0_9PEZI|nr:alpha/beta-hydrolase [Coniochaeta ligniaria NRRL 30616]
MSNLPTLVFVPGSWHQPTCYSKITKILQEKHKLKCVAITLPSTTGNPAATFKDDIDAAREAISRETADGRDVVVIAHSYGGMVGNSAIKDYTRPRDAVESSSTPLSTSVPGGHTQLSQTPTAGHVIGLVLIASGFTLTGMSFMDPFFGHPPPSWRVNKETGYAELVTPPRELFYHDLPAEEADYWASQLTPQSLKALFEGGEFAYAGWMNVPVWYIGTVEDRGLPVAAQRLTVGMAREMGCTVVHRELNTSHSPFLSQPEETAGLVVEAVEAFAGTSVDKELTRQGQGSLVTVPEARLWQPLTWFKFGIPLAFGHILGRCYLIFRWGRGLWGSR